MKHANIEFIVSIFDTLYIATQLLYIYHCKLFKQLIMRNRNGTGKRFTLHLFVLFIMVCDVTRMVIMQPLNRC